MSDTKQAELPDEPVVLGQYRSITRAHNFQDVTKDHYVAETCKEIINYIDALRAHAAWMTVERDEAKERAIIGRTNCYLAAEHGGENGSKCNALIAAERQRDEMLIALNLGKRQAGESPVQTIMRLNDAERRAEQALTWTDEDKPLPEDAEIHAHHPAVNGSHQTYEEALRLVGAKRSKGALVDLVNWLLQSADECARDKERLDLFEAKADKGHAPSLLYDDDGNWAVAEGGMQNIRMHNKEDLFISHIVEADKFKPTVREAIDAARNEEGK